MSIKQDLIDGEIWLAQQRRKMGAKNFNAWIKSQEVNKYTPISDWEELEEVLNKSGYDLDIQHTNKYLYYKTHIGNGVNEFFCWIIKYNKIVASFSINDDKNLVDKFISTIEKTLQKKVFFNSISELNTYKNETNNANKITQSPKTEKNIEIREEHDIEVINEHIFPTVFTDKIILKKAMENIGLTVYNNNGILSSTINNGTIYLSDSTNSNFEFKIVGNIDLNKIYEYYKNIEQSYEKIIQQTICNNIRQKVQQSSTMKLETEEILEDNSVLLTIRI